MSEDDFPLLEETDDPTELPTVEEWLAGGGTIREVTPTKGVCVNHDCRRFEYVVVGAHEGDRCSECDQLLCHESGLTWPDAREKGYATAGVAP